jgi:hypothetical protein
MGLFRVTRTYRIESINQNDHRRISFRV